MDVGRDHHQVLQFFGSCLSTVVLTSSLICLSIFMGAGGWVLIFGEAHI